MAKGYYGGRGVSVELHGFDELMAQLGRMEDAGKRAAGTGMRKVVKGGLEKALEKVPVDKGDLYASGHIVDDGDELKIVFGDDGAVDYAAIVHEKLDLKHPQGQAKYLEAAVNESLNDMAEQLAEELHDTLEADL